MNRDHQIGEAKRLVRALPKQVTSRRREANLLRSRAGRTGGLARRPLYNAAGRLHE